MLTGLNQLAWHSRIAHEPQLVCLTTMAIHAIDAIMALRQKRHNASPH
jgi:hypothetical protein